MKFKNMPHYLFPVILVVVLGIASLCHAEDADDTTSIREVRQETEDMLQTLKDYGVDQRDEALRKTNAALDSLDKRIDSLENHIDTNWDKLDNAARQKARAGLKTLRRQRNQVAEWYGSMKNSTADAWEHMKQGFSDSYKTLHGAWENAEKEFGTAK